MSETGAGKAAHRRQRTSADQPASAAQAVSAEPVSAEQPVSAAQPVTAEQTASSARTVSADQSAAPEPSSDAGAGTEKNPWTWELRATWGRYERRRIAPEAGSDQLKTQLDAGPSSPAVRVWHDAAAWLGWGGELSGGFSSENVDGSTSSKQSITVELLAQLRVMPWKLPWGHPQLTLGVGGLFFDGRFLETNTSSAELTALVPQGKVEVGALIWLVPQTVGLDVALGAGYGLGPAQLHSGAGQQVFLQRLTFEIGAGLAAPF